MSRGGDAARQRIQQLDALCSQVRAVVHDAASCVQQVRATSLETTHKDDRSPVTRADREADALLRSRLTALYPAAWLSEETADSPARLAAASVWIVDPLDGTKEFIAGLPEYCVAVALVEDAVPVLGVVHNPATDEVFWAVRGGGAFLNGQPVFVREGNRMLASRSEIPRGEFEPFAGRWDIVPTGSIQYKLGLIAAGRAAATLSRGPKHEWDVCAGALIVEEAGGRASELLGTPLAYNQPFPKVKGILAAAPHAYSRALTEVETVGAADRMDEFKSQLGS